MLRTITINKLKIQCPRCNSTNLYKFAFDKKANQKYQCTDCKRQIAPGYTNAKAIINVLSIAIVHIHIINSNII
ncbi:IS1/IS1595 family N-terminal zinc-binding domain-containing protein [Clostridium sporogenes]|uniref:IS1/IS1595 family N-terminal zinc-binding domain-containing protein n=1 Tax=Clostridium sporogenes TaxID=1509 RepID=UPI003F8F6EC8